MYFISWSWVLELEKPPEKNIENDRKFEKT